MERGEALRIQACWDGDHFLLYLRSLLQGVLDHPSTHWPLPHRLKKVTLEFPEGRQEITAFALNPKELVELLLHPPLPHRLGADTEWLRFTLSWLLTLFGAQAWYPESQGDRIRLSLLLDSVEGQEGARGLPGCMPASFRAARPDLSASELWEPLLALLGDAVGWFLLRQGAIALSSAALAKLPKDYRELLEGLAQGRRRMSATVAFFDPRQATLTLPERSSRLAFQLLVPDSSEELWQLRPYLQSLEHPEQIVDALRAWLEPSLIPSCFVQPGVSPRFHLLQEFGRALRVFPDLGATLASSPPTALRFSESQVRHFLSWQAECLQAYGYPLLGPPALTRPHTPEITLRLDPSEPQSLHLESPVPFHWSLRFAETEVGLATLDAWLEQPGPLLETSQGFCWVDTKATQRAIRFLKRQASRGSLREALVLAGGGQPIRLELAGELSPLQRHHFEERSEPERFRGQLRSYQRRGYSWLLFMRRLGLGSCLADDMGLGKTVQTLAALCHWKDQGELSQALLVCPTSVLGNWQSEAERFAPSLRVRVHHGSRAQRTEAWTEQPDQFDLLVTSYTLLSRDRELFLSQTWGVVILDEAQQIKNSRTQSARVARDLSCQGRILLTGTPVENRLADLWSLFRFLQPDLLGTYRSFLRRFAHPIEQQRDAEARDHLRRLVGPFLLRRTKTDPQIAPELPAKIESLLSCSLTQEQTRLYRREVEQTMASLPREPGLPRQGAILRQLTRLKQIVNHPALLENPPRWDSSRAGKVVRLLELFDELPEHEGVLIFSQFSRMLEGLQRLLTPALDEEVLLLDGSTPRHLREQTVRRFQGGRGPRVFLLSLKAGGVGLNLTRASTVVHFDRWWNPAVENQASDRAFRIGQTRHVQVFKMCAQDTLEERIDGLLQAKSQLAHGLIPQGDAWLGDLSDQELSELLGAQEVPR